MKKLVLTAILIAGISLCTSAQITRHSTKDAGKSGTVGATHGKKKGWYKTQHKTSGSPGATVILPNSTNTSKGARRYTKKSKSY